MKNVLVSGYFGFGNIGDEIIKEVIDRELKKNNINAIFLVKEKKNKNEIKRTDIIEILKTLKQVDAFISGGGGLLQDKTSLKSLLYYTTLINLSKMTNKKTFVFAQGIGPLKKTISKKIVKHTLNKVDLITVRDDESKNLLLDCGLKNEIIVTSDLAFLYDFETLPTLPIEENYNVLQIKGNESVDIEEITDIARFMHYKTHYETILVPFYPAMDLKLAKTISEKTKFSVFVPKTFVEAFSILNNAKFVVGTRYHSIVFSIMLKKPVLPVFYDEKVKNLSKFIGLTGINIEQLTLSNFAKAFEDFIKKQREIVDLIENKLPQLKENAKRNFEILFEHLH